MGKEGQPGLISMENTIRESNLYFNGKSEVYNIWLISVGRNAGEAELDVKVGTNGDSFDWGILCLQYLAYLNGRGLR